MTTLVKSSGLVLGAVGLVAVTAAATTAVIGSSTQASRAELTPAAMEVESKSPARSRFSYAPSAPVRNSAVRNVAAPNYRDDVAPSYREEATPRYSREAASNNREDAAPRVRSVTLPAGTRLQLRLGSGYSSETSRVEQRVNATVVSGVTSNGYTVIPAGSRVTGEVSSVERPGKVTGRGSISLNFSDVIVGGERYPIAASYTRVAPATKSTDAKKIGIPAAGGAIVGAILGGKKGALTGAAIGGGAGTAVVLSTRGKDAYIGSGSVINVTLRRAVTIEVPAR